MWSLIEERMHGLQYGSSKEELWLNRATLRATLNLGLADPTSPAA